METNLEAPANANGAAPRRARMAERAQTMLGFGAAVKSLTLNLKANGGASGHILLVAYPDGSLGFVPGGAMTPDQILAATQRLQTMLVRACGGALDAANTQRAAAEAQAIAARLKPQ